MGLAIKFDGNVLGSDKKVSGKSLVTIKNGEEDRCFIVPTDTPANIMACEASVAGWNTYAAQFFMQEVDPKHITMGYGSTDYEPVGAIKWHPVSDVKNLPVGGRSVFIYSKEGGVSEGYLNPAGEWIQYRWSARVKPTHWCEKIAPPVGD